MTDEEFEVLAKRDVAGRSEPEDAAWLRSDDQVGRFVDFLAYLEATLAAQIEAFDLGRSKKTMEWRKSSNLFCLRIKARLAEVRPILRSRNERLNEDLRGAIVSHRGATIQDDLEPTEADRELWQRGGVQ